MCNFWIYIVDNFKKGFMAWILTLPLLYFLGILLILSSVINWILLIVYLFIYNRILIYKSGENDEIVSIKKSNEKCRPNSG